MQGLYYVFLNQLVDYLSVSMHFYFFLLWLEFYYEVTSEWLISHMRQERLDNNRQMTATQIKGVTFRLIFI